MQIVDESIILRRQDLLVSEMDGEAVMLDVESGNYFNLNKVGYVIWQYISSTKTLKEIYEHMHTQYQVEVERCKQDTLSFIIHMLDHKMVLVK